MTLKRRNHGGGHSYWASDPARPEADLIKLPGVTTILRETMPKDGLIKWAAESTANHAVDNWSRLGKLPVSVRLKELYGARNVERDRAARRGTEVHKLAEQLVAGAKVASPPELVGHVESYAKFLDDFQPEPVGIELVIVNREVRYCGTADLVALMRGEMWLLDIKTARSGIWPESALQVCAYRHAEAYTLLGGEGEEHPLAELGIARGGAIHVRADGYDLRPVDTGDEPWDYFRNLAWLYRRAEAQREWVGEAIEPLRVAS